MICRCCCPVAASVGNNVVCLEYEKGNIGRAFVSELFLLIFEETTANRYEKNPQTHPDDLPFRTRSGLCSQEPVKYLALAFDDGPNLTTESQMLDLLARHQVPATFFVIGENITDESAGNMKRAIEQGCEIGNHSFTHPMMTMLDEAQVKEEIETTSALIEQITGKRPTLFRPPYINVKPEMYDWIDLTFICGKGCQDWEATADKEFRREGIIANAEPGAIYLLHDFEGNEATVEALDEAIPVLKEQGYVFVTVSELFKKLKCTPDGHTMYTVVPDCR